MKNINYGISLFISAFFLAACSTTPNTPSTVPHTHFKPYVVSLGDRHLHAAMDYNPNYGEIVIRFFDEDEIPYRIFKAEKAKAVIIMPTGAKREFYLINPEAGVGYAPSGSYRYASDTYTTHIHAKESWLKNLPEFKLEAWLPLGEKVYEATFVYPDQS